MRSSQFICLICFHLYICRTAVQSERCFSTAKLTPTLPQYNSVVLSRDILSRCVWSHFLPDFLRLASVVPLSWKHHISSLQLCAGSGSWSWEYSYHSLHCVFMSNETRRKSKNYFLFPVVYENTQDVWLIPENWRATFTSITKDILHFHPLTPLFSRLQVSLSYMSISFLCTSKTHSPH